VTALIVSTRPQEHASLRPVPWRRMAWVTWRQHRVALSGVAALLGALAACLWIVGLQLHHAYAAATACHPASSIACEELIGSFNGIDRVLASGYVLQAVPALIGAFLGAPVLARELEAGTFRYAWTQGFGPWRWTLAKLVALAVVVTVAAGALSVLLSWYYQPYLHPYFAGNPMSLTAESSPLAGGLFDLRGVAFAAWTLAAFAIGGLAGILVRRVVPAIVVTLAAYTALAFATGMFLRRHYLTALLTSKLDVPGSAWIISQRWTTRAGQPVSQSALGKILQAGGPQLAGKGGVPKALGSWQYLVEHGYTLWTTYQPAGRFWTFQWIEGGWLLALSALLIATTVWLVHRRSGLKRREHPGPSPNGRRRSRRTAVTTGAVLAVGIAVAGCGGGSSSPGVAHLSTGTSGGSGADGGGGSSTPESSASAQQKMLAYAQCMRAHGVPNFPDPTSGGGGNQKEAVVSALKQVSNSQAEAAQTACQQLQPNGGPQSQAERAQHLGDLLAFARCMRTHGIPDFPDPTSSGEVTHEMLAKAGVDVHQAAVLRAADGCVGVTHGALTKAAVARFAAGR
jgi:hypothetical protein